MFDNQDEVFDAKSTLLVMFGNILLDNQNDMLDAWTDVLEAHIDVLHVQRLAVLDNHDDVLDE